MTNSKVCKACKKNIGKRTKLQCGQCKGYFHLDCGNVTEVDARLMQAEKSPWTCEGCLTEIGRQSSNFSQPGNRRQSDQFGRLSYEATNTCDVELKMMIRELQTEFREMRRTMEFFNEKYEEEAKRNRVLAEMVSEISKDNQNLKREVDKLKSTLSMQESNKLQANICISGLLDSQDEISVSKGKIIKLIKNLNVELDEQDFESVKLYKMENGAKAVVTLKSLNIKRQILKERAKKGKITIRNMGFGESTQAIFIDEELSKEMYTLFKKAKQVLKNKNYKYIWHRNGRVLARKNDGDRYTIVRSEDHLEEF